MPVRTPSTRLLIAVLAVATPVAATACSGSDDGDGPSATAPTTAAPTEPAPAVTTPDTTIVATPADGSLFPPGDIDAGLAPWVELATGQLAAALDIAPGEIATVSAVLVVWPDASLGCPEPDQQYPQVLTDGAVIELDADGAVYRFHAGGERGPFLCDSPITAPPPRGG